jgi:hypothetical protein
VVKKGKLQEIISKAIHADNPEFYTVGYRDYDTIKEVSLLEFLQVSDNFQVIPASRIMYVKRLDKVLFEKS